MAGKKSVIVGLEDTDKNIPVAFVRPLTDAEGEF